MRKRAVLVAVIALIVGMFGPAPARADDPDQTRILLVGDSVTQGATGDYTWRYRLWKSLRAAEYDVDFVGPLRTLHDDSTGSSTDYADPGFDQDHAALWGAGLLAGSWWIDPHNLVTAEVVAAYQPDVIINDLGLNNLTWWSESPEVLIERMATFVADARAVNPGVTVVLGELTQTWSAGVETYNALLRDLAGTLDRPEARVIAAAKPQDFQESVDTYDTAHPNAQGEVKLAKQFFDVLATLPLTRKAATYDRRARLSGVGLVDRVRLRFTVPTGATRQAVWRRNLTTGGKWRLVTYVGSSRHRYVVRHLRSHHRYAFKLKAYRGSVASTSYSNITRERVR